MQLQVFLIYFAIHGYKKIKYIKVTIVIIITGIRNSVNWLYSVRKHNDQNQRIIKQ